MDGVGFDKVSLPSLQPMALYEESGRMTVMGEEMMRVKDRRDAWHVLSPTAEEVVVDAVRRDISTSRQLPFGVWQCGVKWRDEARARGGPLRGREFVMKDAYSFHATTECVEQWYHNTCQAYARILSRLCPENTWCQARGSSGAMGGNLSHEWLVWSDEGEDQVVGCATCGWRNKEVVDASQSGACSKCSTQCPTRSAIEVGHTFVLGDRYTRPMKLALNGVPLQMGCYGIGVTRLVQTLIGVWNGTWPAHLRPYAAVVVPSISCPPEVAVEKARHLSSSLFNGEDVLLWDDGNPRTTHAQRVQRAQLLGIGKPYQLRKDGTAFQD